MSTGSGVESASSYDAVDEGADRSGVSIGIVVIGGGGGGGGSAIATATSGRAGSGATGGGDGGALAHATSVVTNARASDRLRTGIP
jgi:hypothetical protein